MSCGGIGDKAEVIVIDGSDAVASLGEFARKAAARQKNGAPPLPPTAIRLASAAAAAATAAGSSVDGSGIQKLTQVRGIFVCDFTLFSARNFFLADVAASGASDTKIMKMNNKREKLYIIYIYI